MHNDSQLVLGGYENERTCGRPLGMRLDSDGYLVICDATLGIFKVNVATGMLNSAEHCHLSFLVFLA